MKAVAPDGTTVELIEVTDTGNQPENPTIIRNILGPDRDGPWMIVKTSIGKITCWIYAADAKAAAIELAAETGTEHWQPIPEPMTTDDMILRYYDMIGQYDRAAEWAHDGNDEDRQRLAEVCDTLIGHARGLVARLLAERNTK